MTTIVAKIDAFDMSTTDLSGARNYLHKSLTPTEARFYDNANNYNSFIGIGLTYDAQGYGLFVDGTITAIHSVVAGTERVSATGFSLDAWNLEGILRANDPDGLWDSILAGNDVIRGSNSTTDGDYLLGNAGNDRIYGNAGDDTLKGETGSDKLFGGKGGDHLFGGLGNDRLDGGQGVDLLSGGAGRDSFVFGSALNAANSDFILDFKPIDDSILLSAKVFTHAGPTGTLAAGRFYEGTAAHDANDRIIYDATSGALSYDNDGNGPHAQVTFAYVYPPQSALTFADFIII